MTKPFWKSLPISINDLPSRQELAMELASHLSHGESVFLTGELRVAKTSLIRYLMTPQNEARFFDSRSVEFNYIDCQSLPTNIDSKEFWEIALSPLIEERAISKDDLFPPHRLQRALKKYLGEGKLYVVVLDEFDVLLSHPILRGEHFILGALRQFATGGYFSLLISSHYSLTDLNTRIWEGTGKYTYGSPPLNFLRESWVRPLPDSDVIEALKYATPPFTPSDRQYIIDISGGHPFLIEVATTALWEHKDEGKNRYYLASETIHRIAEPLFLDKWRKWEENYKKAITAVALVQVPLMFPDKDFLKKDLLLDLTNFRSEIRRFQSSGEIIEDKNILGGYRIRQEAMLWWIAEEILKSIRHNNNFNEWLLERSLQNKSSEENRAILDKTTEFIGRMLEKGSTTLIEAYIKNLVTT